MKARHAPLCLALAAAAVLAPAAPASAVERIDAAFLTEYTSTSYVVDQGEIVTFGNRDKFLRHGIDSDTVGLFNAPVVERGQSRLVRGAPYLTAGAYTFHCPIHPAMTSKLTVTAGGSPLPPDAVRPGAVVKIKTGALGKLLGKKRLRVTVVTTEAADAAISGGAAGVAIGRAESTYVTAGRRSFTLPLDGATARSIAAKARTGQVAIKVKVRLTDAAGNVAVVKQARKLGAPRPAAKKKPPA
jgi:plastocyanin